MEETTYTGYLYGLVIDADTGKIVDGPKVTPKSEGLIVVMPFEGEKEGDGIYFATGEPGTYSIETVAAKYDTSNMDIEIDTSSKQKNIYLNPVDPDVKQSSAVQKARKK